jgi:hypothetical protein
MQKTARSFVSRVTKCYLGDKMKGKWADWSVAHVVDFPTIFKLEYLKEEILGRINWQ